MSDGAAMDDRELVVPLPDGHRFGPGPLLTDKERAAIRIAGDLWGALCDIVADTDPVVRLGDLQELIAPIHVIQRYVMGQAAARAYPAEFRLLGSRLPERER